MDSWFPATVKQIRPAALQMVELTVGLTDPALAREHLSPGQYVKLRLAGQGESYFAITSRPSAYPEFEFLIKLASPLSAAIAGLPVGSTLEMSKPQGRGFPLGRAVGKNVLLIATGSGMSAIRPVVETICARRQEFGTVTLLVGARVREALPYADLYPSWERAGVGVVPVLSQPGEGWNGARGWVQGQLDTVAVEGAVAFLVGQKAMVQEVTEKLTRRGLPPDDILLNF